MLTLVLLTSAVQAQEYFFSVTEMQLFADFNREPGDSDIYEMTIEHFAEARYGDHYFMVDIEGRPDFKFQPSSFFFLYKPRLSLDKLFKKKILPSKFLGEIYLVGQYTGSSNPNIEQVWYYGISIDFAIHPNYGYSNLNFYVRDEDTQDRSYHINYTWEQPFRLWKFNLNCKGFAEIWENDVDTVFFAEPQIRLNLSSFVSEKNFLAKTAIGLEYEMSNNLYGSGYGWETNPGVFFAYQF